MARYILDPEKAGPEDDLDEHLLEAADAFVEDHPRYIIDTREDSIYIHNRGWTRPYYPLTDMWGFRVEEGEEPYAIDIETNSPSNAIQSGGGWVLDQALSPLLGSPQDRFRDDVQTFLDYLDDIAYE